MKSLSIPIHIWTYNHPINGITDQIDFLVMVCSENGYLVSIGNKPNIDALNIVIENFSNKSRDILIKFCKRYKKLVAIVMTEHLDFEINTSQVLMHGDRLNTMNDYMHPLMQIKRIKHLIECREYISCFLTLGDLPILKNFHKMLPNINLYRIIFPMIAKCDITTDNLKTDLLFTGTLTVYREQLLKKLRDNNFSIYYPQRLLSKDKHHALNVSSKVILNLPQRVTWQWLSSMRILAGLKAGRMTVSLQTNDTSKISRCCQQLNYKDSDWVSQLQLSIINWQNNYQKCLDNYYLMRKEFVAKNPFPHNFFLYWAGVEYL